MDEPKAREIALYLQNANEMLNVARLNFDNDFYASSVNRAYYAVFYDANALLASKGLARKKHSGVINAFRSHFVKTDLFDIEYSNIFGQLFEDRNEGDYELESSISKREAAIDIEGAQQFVDEVRRWLQQGGWL